MREMFRMISYILLVVGIIITLFSYLLLFIKWIFNKNKVIDEYSGFDASKEVTSNYDEINIVSSSDVIFSEYDIKRNVIRLNSKNYDSNSYFDVAVSVLLAGYSLVNVENKNYFKFVVILKRIGYIGFVSLIGSILSCFISNIGDAKIGIVIFGVLLVYQYMKYQMNVDAGDKIKEVLDKEKYDNIENIISSIINFNKLSFIIMLIFIIRLVVIILGM